MRWTSLLAAALALGLPLLSGCADERDRGRYDDEDRRRGDLRYDDTRYGDARDVDGDESGYRDVRWDARDDYDENYRSTTNDEVSAPRDYTPPDTPGVGDPDISPAGSTQRRDWNPSPRDSYRRSDIP
jgi:hypothetical protein